MKERRAPVKVERPVDLRGMKSLNELQQRQIERYVELAAEKIVEAVRAEVARDYIRRPRWWPF